MDFLFYPIVTYYRFFSLLLPFSEWVIVIGILLLVITKKKYATLKVMFSNMHSFTCILMLIIVLVGVFGSMPTSLLYGGIGGEIGTSLGESMDNLFGFSWKFFNILFGVSGTIISVMAMIAWSILIWSIISGILVQGLNLVLKMRAK